jgi:hypothetical protein
MRLQLNRSSSKRPMQISVNQFFRQNNATGGILRIPVVIPQGDPHYVLRIRGSSDTQLLQQNGFVLQGDNLELSGNGVLQIKYPPGLLMAWLDNRKSLTLGSSEHEVILEKPNQSTTLKLSTAMPTQVIQAKQDSVLHLHSDTPLITRIVHSGGNEQVQAYPNGIATDIYLPQGKTQLSVSAISGQSLAGTLDLSNSALTEINEGTGSERLLVAGGAQFFSFKLNQTTTIGVGLQASSDLIQGKLLNSNGDIIGHGVVQMLKLEPGRYVLAAYASPQDQSVTIRPVLIGTQPKATTPPKDVILRYMRAAGIKFSENN